ncbi:MAG TPA: CHAT domain-containing protein [Blastocatellia bacterium]|nr:CHAT domain-containing protein [Blastocatellia bacterium]HMZ20238.1 CHAT domain-containing protein [Blastocatellia bacterium]HNG30878.1 CHAT domain-containing protein [Blastocatellia bacterium]
MTIPFSRPLSRLLMSVFVLVCFSIPAFAQSDEAALRTIVGKYFEAYARKDWPAMTALWDETSPALGRRYEALDSQFSGFDLSFTEPVLSRIRIEGENASLRIATRRIAAGKTDNTRMLTEVRLELSFVKRDGQWKIWNEASPVGSLLNALADAKTEDARRKLLDDDAELANRDLLILLLSQSDRTYALGDYSRALSLLQCLILVAERLNDQNELSDAWHKTGIIHFLQKRFDDALTAYRRSLAIEEQQGRKYETARSLNSIGLLFLGQAKFPEALDHFQRALIIYEALDKKSDVTQTVENIGNVYYEQGDVARAVEFYLRSVKLREENKMAVQAAHLMLKIARVELEQGRDAAAIDYFRQGAERLAAAGDRRSLGYAFHNIANILYDQGDYNQALTFYQRSLDAERAAGTRQGEAGALQGIGLIHSLNGNHASALQAHELNLAIAKALGEKKAWAAAWQKVAGSLFSLGKYDESLAAYNEALALHEQIGDVEEIALAALDVGVTLAAKQDYAAALGYYERSGKLYEGLNNLPGVAATLINTAMVYYQQNDFQKTLEVAERAATVASLDLDLFWQARYRAGKAHFKLNDLAAARKSLTEAITIIESMRPQSNRGQQPRFYENKIAPYQAMVDVAIGENLGYEAFAFAERARARVLTGVLQNAKTRIVKTMTPREQERETQLLTAINNLNAQVYREQERNKSKSPRLDELNARLQKAQSDYTEFRNRLYALHPVLKTLRGELKPATAELAAAALPDAKTAFLEFVETEERVYLFLFGKGIPMPTPTPARRKTAPAVGLRIFVLAANRAGLYAKVSGFNQAIAARAEDLNAQARDLYDLLLKDAQPYLEGRSKLTIAPDAISWALPFQALRNEAERFLIEDFAFSYTPSLTIFNAVANTRIAATIPPGRAGARQQSSAALLAVSDPAISPNTAELLKAALQTEPLAPLPPLNEAEKEIAALSESYAAKDRLLLSGAEASETRVKAEIGKHRFIHLAARGLHHEASPLFSLLTLTPDAEAQEDGLLDLREILRLDLKAELVTLSAGDWAKPQTVSNRAMTAWTWAWFVAGASATLLSQWRAESPSTASLMKAFHQQLKAPLPKSKATAWQSAVKELLSQKEFRQPFFWAGFTMLGNGK